MGSEGCLEQSRSPGTSFLNGNMARARNTVSCGVLESALAEVSSSDQRVFVLAHTGVS